jgi:hypothetical protein
VVRVLGRYSTVVHACQVLFTVRAAVLAAVTTERLMTRSRRPPGSRIWMPSPPPACCMPAVLSAGGQARDHRGGPGERKHDG